MLNEVEKPLLLVYADESVSITAEEQNRFSTWFEGQKEALGQKYDVHYRRFGSEVAREGDSIGNSNLNTDYSKVVESINEDHYNQNVGAIIVATDGIQNLGQDPFYQDINQSGPLEVFALGDSVIQPDFEITEILNNDLVFLGNKFQIKVRYKAKRMQGNLAWLTLFKNGKKVDGVASEIVNSLEAREYIFELEADQIGLNRFTLSIEPHGDEKKHF